MDEVDRHADPLVQAFQLLTKATKLVNKMEDRTPSRDVENYKRQLMTIRSDLYLIQLELSRLPSTDPGNLAMPALAQACQLLERIALASTQVVHSHGLEFLEQIRLLVGQIRMHLRPADQDAPAMLGKRSTRKDKRKFYPKRAASCKKRKMVWKNKLCVLRK